MTQWTAARQAPLSMGFSRQEYWSGLPFPSPGDFPDPGIESKSVSPALQVNSLPLSHQGNPGTELLGSFTPSGSLDATVGRRAASRVPTQETTAS